MSAESVRGIMPSVPIFVQFLLNLDHWFYSLRLYLKGVKNFDSVLQRPSSEGIRSIAKWVDAGKLKPVIGKTVKLEDIEGIREVCTQIASGKGSLGKTVIVVS